MDLSISNPSLVTPHTARGHDGSAAELAPGLQSTVIQEATFNSVGRDYIDNSTKLVSINLPLEGPLVKAFDLLRNHISEGAAHDSYERGGIESPKCHPETRRAIQEAIMGWIGDGKEGATTPTIMWLSGPAGSGKTAIAGSIADACHSKAWLAGSFFFAVSGSSNRRSKRYIVPTLAYHLIQQKSIPGLRDIVLAAIADTPSVFEKRLDEQMKILVLDPLRQIPPEERRGPWPRVIIIDGLDECDADLTGPDGRHHSRKVGQELDQREIAETLRSSSENAYFPFCILISSRPEPVIRDSLLKNPGPAQHLFLDAKYEPDADVRLFLVSKFCDIRQRFAIPEDWPSPRVIRTLVERSSGQFIYPTTVVRFIENRERSPPEQLERVLEWRALGASHPLSAMDTLYTKIIETSPNPALALKWLYVFEELRGRLTLGDAWLIKGMLEERPGQMGFLLGNLSSLIDFGPKSDGLPDFRFYHKSFGDFLHDKDRGGVLIATLFNLTKGVEKFEEIVQNFVEDRVYEVFRHRGTQGVLVSSLPSGLDAANVFFKHVCYFLPETISARHEYNDADITFWLSSLRSAQDDPETISTQSEEAIRSAYGRVHKDCNWHGCSPICKLWRKAIRQHCKSSGLWQLPTAKERLVDRFRPFYEEEAFLGGEYEHDFGLRVLREKSGS